MPPAPGPHEVLQPIDCSKTSRSPEEACRAGPGIASVLGVVVRSPGGRTTRVRMTGSPGQISTP
jgi:hypothetical protein